MITGIWRIEKALPEWLGIPQIQWVIWAYAVFQLLRNNLLFLFIISCVVYKIKHHIVDPFFYGFVRVHVYLIPYALRFIQDCLTTEDGDEYFQRHPPKTFRVVPRDESWPSEWRVVEFNGWQYFTTKSALDTMAAWISRHCHGDDKKALFVHRHVIGLPGERISREQAYEKFFSGSYLVGDYSGLIAQIPSALDYSEMNGKLWGVLSTIPVLLQAWNYNRTSTLVAFIIILLDFFRSVVNKIYHRLCLNIRLYVKSKLNMELIQGDRCRLFLSAFINMKRIEGDRFLELPGAMMAIPLGWRWMPTTYLHWKHMAEEGMEIRVYPHCKVKSVNDVMRIHGSGYYTSDETYPGEGQVYNPNDNPMLMLWGKRAVLVSNLSHPPKVQFGVATLKKGIVVEHSL